MYPLGPPLARYDLLAMLKPAHCHSLFIRIGIQRSPSHSPTSMQHLRYREWRIGLMQCSLHITTAKPERRETSLCMLKMEK